MTLKRLSDDSSIEDENKCEQFVAALVYANDTEIINCWINDNKDVLNGRHGKKLETPLHR